MTEEEREFVGNYLSERPDAGALLVGSGGVRKLRIAGRGTGKSGGYRVLTFYKFEEWPVFLLDVFSKGEKPNLTAAELQILAKAVHEIIEEASK